MDSRDVAKWVEKRHDHLCRDIAGYITHMLGVPKVGVSDFFIESTYKSEQNKALPCYLITRKGCEFVANKLIGKKGTLFTAAYITRFHEYEERLKSANNQKANLLLSIYNGGQGAIAASKELVELETAPLRAEAELLSAQMLEWADRSLLVAIIRRYSINVYDNFSQGWVEFKKELVYRHGINLNSRITKYLNNTGKRTKPMTTDMLDDTEMPNALATAVAMCREKEIGIADLLENRATETPAICA